MPRPATHRPHIAEQIRTAGRTGITTSQIAHNLGYQLPQVYKDVKILETEGKVRRAGKGHQGGDLLVWAEPASDDATGSTAIRGKVIGEGLRLGTRYQVVGMGIADNGTEVTMRDDNGTELTILLG